jgi:hypothetical protein
MVRTMSLPISLLMFVLCTSIADAWLRPTYEDATVVARSELIVIAHLKVGSTQHVPHKRPSGEGASWEYHAVLVIGKVLKGKCDKAEIPLILHYGLSPDVRKGNVIEIHDTGNSALGSDSLVKDAEKENLWFLRKRSGYFGREPGTGNYGIVDPEDVQPLQWQSYFLSYLAEDPATAVREYVRKFPVEGQRGKNYLDHLEVQRILKMKDPSRRYDSLLPFFLKRTTWNMKEEAREGMVACGKPAGARLNELFADPKHKKLRYEIIQMWREMGYRENTVLLIDLLKQHDRFWAEQRLQKGWWNDYTNPDQPTDLRRDIYGEVYGAVCALRSFRDPRAKEALEMTRKRWVAINFDNTQIVEECGAALRELVLPPGGRLK